MMEFLWCFITLGMLLPAASVQVFPLKQRIGHVKDRHGSSAYSPRVLLGNHGLNLHGSVDFGYFYTDISLGSPPRPFTMIVDSGSTLMYVPCADCADGQCGTHHLNAPFDPASSSTFVKVDCGTTNCTNMCGSRSCCSPTSATCTYSRSYAEGSSIRGNVISDVIWLQDGVPAPRVTFGCEEFESGEIKNQQADGIVGMGIAPIALHRQLSSQGVFDSVFTLCFGQQGGAMVLGDLPGLQPVAVTPEHPQPYRVYHIVQFRGIAFGGAPLSVDVDAVNRGYGAVFDSGTTYTYFPKSVLNVIIAYLQAHADAHGMAVLPPPYYGYNDYCWSSDVQSMDDLGRAFPNMTLSFDSADLELFPKSYLWAYPRLSTSELVRGWCLGLLDNGESTGALFGGISVRDVAVTYDLRTSPGKIAFTHVDCANFPRASDLGPQSNPGVSQSPPPMPDTETTVQNASDVLAPVAAPLSPPPPVLGPPPPVAALPANSQKERYKYVVVTFAIIGAVFGTWIVVLVIAMIRRMRTRGYSSLLHADDQHHDGMGLLAPHAARQLSISLPPELPPGIPSASNVHGDTLLTPRESIQCQTIPSKQPQSLAPPARPVDSLSNPLENAEQANTKDASNNV